MVELQDTPARGRLLVRKMALSDLDAVTRIEELSFTHPWSRSHFRDELLKDTVSRCLVAVGSCQGAVAGADAPAGSEIIVGFIMAWLVADELHITNLAVDPEKRRAGAAAALLEHSLREAVHLGARWCQLEVRESNQAARNLYRRFGFGDLGVRRGYYHNGEDAVVMGKDLEP